MWELWLTDEKNPASAYAHQCRMGVTTRAQSRMAFVGQTGETNRGGRLLATVSVLRKHVNPTSRTLSNRPTIQRPAAELGRRAGSSGRLSVLLIPGAATMADEGRPPDKPARS